MRRPTLAAALGVALAFTPILARAQDPIALNREAARALAEKGLDLLAAGDYGAAVEHFQRAEARFHAPTHMLFMGQAYEKLGKLVEARATYERVIAEKLPNYAPDAFREAQAEALARRDQLAGKIPTLTIGAMPGARVSVDGEAVAVTTPLPLNPGAHTVVAVVEGQPPQSRTVNLREGAAERIELRSNGAAAAPAPIEHPSASPPPPRSPEQPTDQKPGSLVPAAVAFGIGGVGVIVGAATGIVSLSDVSKLNEACPAKTNCPPDAQHYADAARTLGTVSTVAFIVGAAGLAAGIVLVAIRPGGSNAHPRPALRAKVGPGGLNLAGQF